MNATAMRQLGRRAAWTATTAIALLASVPAGAASPAAPTLTREQSYAMALEAQTEKDYDAMLRWLRSSAEAGFRPAQDLLGIALLGGPALFGEAVQRQPCEALAWFIRSADQGSELGRMHRNLLNRQPLGRACHGGGRSAS